MNIFKKKAPIIRTFNYKTLTQKYSNPTRMGLPLRHTRNTYTEKILPRIHYKKQTTTRNLNISKKKTEAF